MSLGFLKMIGVWLFLILCAILGSCLEKIVMFMMNRNLKKDIVFLDTTCDFDALYQNLFSFYEEKTYIKKKAGKIIVAVFAIITLLSVPSFMYIAMYTNINYETYGKVVAFILLVGIIALFKIEFKFIDFYKSEIVGTIAKMINSSFEYKKKERKRLTRQYKEAGFVDESYDFAYTKTYIVGSLDGSASVGFGCLKAEKHKGYDENSYSIPIFTGVVACMSYNNDIKNKIYIKQSGVVNLSGELSEFLKNRLDEICEAYRIFPEIIIKRNYVFLRIHTGEFFEPGKDPMDKQMLFNYYIVIRFINEIMTEIKNATEV